MILFPESNISFDLPDADIEYFPFFFAPDEAQRLFKKLMADIPWQQDEITIFGKKLPQPRLTAFFGDANKVYAYSAIIMKSNPWNETLLEIKTKLETATKLQFNSVLLNLYRDGNDSNGWHSDDEKELGKNPVIASISFGEKRIFQLKHKTKADQKKSIELEKGSLLVMKGTTQHYWKHQVPKTKRPVNARINLTFRTIF